MLRCEYARARGAASRVVTKSQRVVVLLALGSVVAACGGGGGSTPAKTPAAEKKPESVPGLPTAGGEGWCDPVPELGEGCSTDLKECTIACDYISDTCAMLVCLGSTWEYVEHGEEGEEQ